MLIICVETYLQAYSTRKKLQVRKSKADVLFIRHPRETRQDNPSIYSSSIPSHSRISFVPCADDSGENGVYHSRFYIRLCIYAGYNLKVEAARDAGGLRRVGHARFCLPSIADLKQICRILGNLLEWCGARCSPSVEVD